MSARRFQHARSGLRPGLLYPAYRSDTDCRIPVPLHSAPPGQEHHRLRISKKKASSGRSAVDASEKYKNSLAGYYLKTLLLSKSTLFHNKSSYRYAIIHIQLQNLESWRQPGDVYRCVPGSDHIAE